MMTHQEVKSLLARLREPSPCVVDCLKVLSANRAVEVALGPGHMSMHEAARIFRLRRDSVTGRTETCGMDETLAGVLARPEGDGVFLFHYSYPEQVITVFIDECSRDIVGCIRVMRGHRDGLQPPLREEASAPTISP